MLYIEAAASSFLKHVMNANTWCFGVGWSSGLEMPLMSPKGMKASCTTASVEFSSSSPAQEGNFNFDIQRWIQLLVNQKATKHQRLGTRIDNPHVTASSVHSQSNPCSCREATEFQASSKTNYEWLRSRGWKNRRVGSTLYTFATIHSEIFWHRKLDNP